MAPFSFLLTLLLYTLSAGASVLESRSSALLPRAGSLQQVTNFGDNPTNVGMYIYVPNNLASNPGIIVAIHYCTGTAEAYYNGSPYAKLAEKHGFIVIYPESPYQGKCWDVSSRASLTHNGGGNSNSIANMVKWTIKKYKTNTSKVFVTGSSSGAMMTNVMAATYPDMFAAGVVYSGVAAGCFMSNTNQQAAWNSTCAHGKSIATPEAWAHVAKAMYPGYDGPRPRMQIYHGSADTTLYPQNYQETCKEWAGVFGYDYNAPRSVENNKPQANYKTTTWGKELQGIYATGVGHTVPINGDRDMAWFGFAK
ncbi:acetyl xylan esterase [Aspergillus clavatus NRRL 1]|uniref:Probable acetylxylan esterase A n=1 Tax=Aspergillus clavatus (strain ATCC 1007 / CBS 513.65 / DSM 816 / NCTC 3887 / NRRL 1 / QM 1276 / 107) TaxID=344612 RepID=AXE1_ASPCL|nr:acetyl xylan esterase, putative [Aspergillus clavatus NRRL 1]A1CSZ8.1 RecName: Full=Probable acetylxylan esterase A; Flags: Precursor [Aspergillus clavatus NRRL 1]EAW06435.1 acetyl xylan esterase, putative [Aspergillus clavatus NRRL 1]